MSTYKPMETDDYRGLARMFYENGLEVKPDGPQPEGLIACWEVLDSCGERIAGIELETRAGEYVVGGITVLEPYRKSGIGEIMLRTVTDKVKEMGGQRAMLVAKVPEFFEKSGFHRIAREDSPEISKCFTCDQFETSCFPAVMEKPLNEDNTKA